MDQHGVDETGGGRQRPLPGGAGAVLIPHPPPESICGLIDEMNPAPLAKPFLAVSPAGTGAAMAALKVGENKDQRALKQFRLPIERARYQARRGERRHGRVEPENQLVARTLEAIGENKLPERSVVDTQSARPEREQRSQLTEVQREPIGAFGGNLKRTGTALTTTDRNRKELQRGPGTKTACVGSFTANRIASLRHDWKIVCYWALGTALAWGVTHRGSRCRPTGHCGIDSAPAQWPVHRGRASHPWGSLADSHDPTTQEPDRAESPPRYVAMPQAPCIQRVARQTIMQRVKHGELAVVHVSCGKQKGLRIRVLDNQSPLVAPSEAAKV